MVTARPLSWLTEVPLTEIRMTRKEVRECDEDYGLVLEPTVSLSAGLRSGKPGELGVHHRGSIYSRESDSCFKSEPPTSSTSIQLLNIYYYY